ncbi:MAG: hypothetical protein WDO71_12740 [Bacteroidota bacterium]
MKNGLTVFLMEQHEVPVMNVSVILPAGAIYDGEKAGIGFPYGCRVKVRH